MHRTTPVNFPSTGNIWGKYPRSWAIRLYHKPRLMIVAFMLYTHDGLGGCYPSIDTLAEECELPKNRIYVALRELEKLGFFIVRYENDRKFFDLQPYPKVSKLGAKRVPELVPKQHHVSTVLAPDSKVRVTDPVTNPVTDSGASSTLCLPRSTISLPSTHPHFAPPLPTEDNVTKIVGPIRRGSDDAPPAQTKARKIISGRDQILFDTASWFSQKCYARFDVSKPAMQKWASIYNRYEQKSEIVKQVCLEAYECRDTLLSDEWPVWGVQSVWFYMSYKRKEITPTDHARIIKLHERGREFKALRSYIEVHGVSRETVRGIVQAKFYDELFPEVVRGS